MPERSSVGALGSTVQAVVGSHAADKRVAEDATLRPVPSSFRKEMTPQGRSAWMVVIGAVGITFAGVAAGKLPVWSILLGFAVLGEGAAVVLDVLASWRRAAAAKRRKAAPAQQRSTDGKYTWQQVAQHCTEESAWIAVRGKVYDVTDFVDSHPGGRELLLLCCGRDATDLFVSYHPFTKKPEQVLKKFLIGDMVTYEHPVYPVDSGFYETMCKRVKEHLDEQNIDHKNVITSFAKMMPAYVMGAFAFVAAYLRPDLPLAWRAVCAILFGIGCQGIPLTGWMHDSSHASIGHSEWWWYLIGRISLDWIAGSSMVSWRNQHVIGHHVYTNVMGADPDLPMTKEGDPRRIAPSQFWASVYKYQYVYMPVLYGVLGLKSRYQDVFEIFSAHTNGPIRVNPISVQDNVRQFASKSFWAFFRFVVPHVFFQLPWKEHILLFLCSEFVTGYWLAYNFQVSHVTTVADWYESHVDQRDSEPVHTLVEKEWAHTQLYTTIDYGHNNFLATYLSGGLNYQTIHHLLPTVSQHLYPQLTPIVMDECKKRGLPYNVFRTYREAISAHIEHLKIMGQEGRKPELKLE
ncbi:Delta(5) fatty acid desaturase A [Porphyridium purpureum]|uniref:Delta(5) fatty acid desaturase A n=1 Tax=Porphyridium purpureum TaxID=35688 RepID=A0A5J4Z1U9_PORPP|nr:Delta(5) fatty acid desaturase A [Porphyridium purpureum]|eukprot:POR8468..scf208_2